MKQILFLLAVVFSLSAQAQFNISATATGPGRFRAQAVHGPNSTREIYTVDEIPPVLDVVTISSNNANSGYAKEGNIITLSFTASEALAGTPTVTIAGQPATVTISENSYLATYQMTSAEAEDIIPFTIDFEDLAGNPGSTVAATTDNSQVIYDITVPTYRSSFRYLPDAFLVDSTSLVFIVTFSEFVTGIDASDFYIQVSGTAMGNVSTVSTSSGSQVYVTVDNVSGTGTIELEPQYMASLYDMAGNAFVDFGHASGYYTVVNDQPFARSIKRQSPAGEFTKASSVTYRVTFSKDVTGVDATDFSLSSTGFVAGAVIGSVVTVTGSSVYDVPVSGITGEGTLRMDLNTSGTAIQDDVGNVLYSEWATTGETYTFDQTVPTLDYVDISSTPMYYVKEGDVVSLSFMSVEPITNITATIAGNIITVDNIFSNFWYGTYTITTSDPEGFVPFTISFTDLAGNYGQTVTKTIGGFGWVIYDKTPPVLTVAKLYSNNINNTQYAKPGDYVYLEFKFSEPIYPLNILINGNSAYVVGQLPNGNLKARYLMPVSAEDGLVSFSIEGYHDNAGNTGATVTTTTDGSSITFDKTLPVLTSVHISSNNSNSSLAKAGDLLTATFVAGEIVQNISLTIAGHTVSVTDLGSYTYQGTYTMTTDDPEGSVSFTIDFTDLVGNTGLTVTATTDASTVTFDKTAPTLNTVVIYSDFYNPGYASEGNVVYLDFTASEPLKASSVRLAGHKVTATTSSPYRASWRMDYGIEGPVSFSITVSDLAGNISGVVTTTTNGSSVIYDITAPHVVSSLRYDPAIASTISTTVVFQVTFSEAVFGVDVNDFLLTAGAPSTGTIASVATVTSSVYNVTVNVTNGGGGTLRLDVKYRAKIFDVVGYTLSAGYTSGEFYTFGIAPTITCPSTKTFTNASGTCTVSASVATLTSGATIGGVPTPTITVVAGTTTITTSWNLDVGTTTVTLVASNGILPNASCQYTVNVADVLPPTISALTASPNVLWPPNHKLRDINLSSTVTDLCGTYTTTVSISSNEPINNTSDGDKEPDWIVDPANSMHLQLRGERANGGNGRIYTVLITATDAAGNTATATVPVYVVHNITNPVTGSPFKIGSTLSFAGVFWDKPGTTHSGQWLLDNSTSTRGSIIEPSGNKAGKITGTYRFNVAGVYKLQMNITDQNKLTSYCNTNEDQEAIVVIYDPNGGYTYGGGYFNSPAGALSADPSFTGKANFGFTINYYKGATYPKGETQFNLMSADFEFNALNFDYLSISGAMAQFRGTGKITGDISGVNFIMTVIDGQRDGTGIDKIRIKIWNKNTGYVYYDNEPGKSDADKPTNPVALNSSIVVYNIAKSQKSIIGNEAATNGLVVVVHPNPANTEFEALVKSPDKLHAVQIQMFDATGRLIEQMKVNEGQFIHFGRLYKQGIYYLRAMQGSQRSEARLIKLPE